MDQKSQLNDWMKWVQDILAISVFVFAFFKPVCEFFIRTLRGTYPTRW